MLLRRKGQTMFYATILAVIAISLLACELITTKPKNFGSAYKEGSYFEKEGVFSIKSILIQIEPLFLNSTYKEFLPKIELALCCAHEDDKNDSYFIPAYKCKPIE